MLNKRVKVLMGRNKNQYGVIKAVNDSNVYVDFNREILVNEGFGSLANYPDGYWVNKKFIEIRDF